MISVSDAFSVEETDSTRRIAHSLEVAWKKDFRSTIRFFTIGVSTIGGPDIIPGPAGVQSAWNKYLYEDESAYALGYGYERELSMPLGGMTKALAEAELDNTSGRFTPRHMGGTSAIYTANSLPRRPVIINAGFEVGGVPIMVPQFVGLTTRPLQLDRRRAEGRLVAEDFVGFLQNSYIDDTAMFTNERSDEVIASALSQLGFSTAQYDLDYGLNRIGFGLYERGQRWGDFIHKLAEAENAHIYQDEEGVIRFENRQHWDNFPHFNVQRVIGTNMVLNAKGPDYDHIINVVEVTGHPREVESNQLLWEMNGYAGSEPITLPPGERVEVWANYNDPVFEVDTPTYIPTTNEESYYVADTEPDGSGSDVSASVQLSAIDNFAQATKLMFKNFSGAVAYLTNIQLWGRPARRTGDIYYRGTMGSSITAFEERILKIDNDYIQDVSWARSYAEMVLQDFAWPENLQEITIRAIPELQLGDLISWQGRYWRVYGIRTMIDPGVGFVQELKLLQRTITTYFRIGISVIGGPDRIAP